MAYLQIKLLHQALVAISVLGFVARASGAVLGATWVRHRLARTLPHLVDTALLASGFWLALSAWLSASGSGWLVAKLMALVLYIGLGAVAMRPTFSFPVRVASLLMALATVAWMVSVARSKNPLGAMAALVS